MDWKRIGRTLLCLLVVAVLVINVCTVEAHASMMVTGTASIIAVSALPYIKAFLIGLGVAVGLEVTGFNALAAECLDYLVAHGLATETTISILGFEWNGSVVNAAPVEVISAIWDFLWNSGTLTSTEVPVSGTGVSLVFSEYITSEAKEFWGNIDIYTSANAAVPGQILLLSGNSTSLPSSIFGLGRVTLASGIDVLYISSVSNNSISPFTTVDFPVGEFVSLDGYTITTRNYDYVGSDGYNCTKALYLNYDDALLAYQNSLSTDVAYYYLTPESYFIPYTSSASSTGRSNVIISSIANLGRISSGGEVTVGTYNITIGESYNSYRYVFVPGSITTEIVYDSTVGEVGYIGNPNEELSVGYSTWFENALTVIDPITQEEISVIPVPDVGTNTNFSEITQVDVWKGQITDAITDAQAGTVAGTAIGDFMTAISDTVVTPLLNGIASIFVPSEDFLTDKFNAIRAEFSFADSIMSTVDFFGTGLKDIQIKPPVIYVDLGASTGDYDFGGEVVFMDLSWYEDYKPIGDALISAFLWAILAWRLFLKLPSIIGGMPGDFVYTPLDVSGLKHYLPSRNARFESMRNIVRRMSRDQ